MYDHGYEARPRRRWLQGVGIATVVAVLGIGAYALGQASREAPQAGLPNSPVVAPAPPSAGTAPPRGAPAVAAGPDPVVVATSWLQAYRSVRFDDPTPAAWIDHVRPVVTDRLAATYEQYRDGSVGADWTQFVSRQCMTTIEDLNGVIPDEAPRTATTVNVQVAAVLRTRCAAGSGDGSGVGDEVGANGPVSATVTLKKARDGLWRVDKRLY